MAENKQRLTIGLVTKPGTTLKYKTGGWRTYKPVVNHEKCIGCKRCADSCMEGAPFECAHDGKKKKFCINYDYCKGCGVCAYECPVDAIEMVVEEK